MIRSAILSLGLVAFVLGLTGCGGGSEQPKAAPPADQEKARGQRTQPEGTKGTEK